MFRIGQGFDVHAFGAQRPLILGGVQIPFHQGLIGHSDADVLLHAIIDALLGATTHQDIGEVFPDNESQYKNIASQKLLLKAAQRLHEQGYQLVNLDSTIIAQAPKIQPYRQRIIQNIATLLKVNADQINVKAKTFERIGCLGRQEGIAVQAVALLTKSNI